MTYTDTPTLSQGTVGTFVGTARLPRRAQKPDSGCSPLTFELPLFYIFRRRMYISHRRRNVRMAHQLLRVGRSTPAIAVRDPNVLPKIVKPEPWIYLRRFPGRIMRLANGRRWSRCRAGSHRVDLFAAETNELLPQSVV
jgi:hypothetical protein